MEQERIEFMLSRDGLLATIEWAKRTVAIYKSGLDGNSIGAAWMRLPEYRNKFQNSINDLTDWLNQPAIF